MQAYMHTRMNTCICAHTMHTCLHTYTHLYAGMHMHKHMYVHLPTFLSFPLPLSPSLISFFPFSLSLPPFLLSSVVQIELSPFTLSYILSACQYFFFYILRQRLAKSQDFRGWSQTCDALASAFQNAAIIGVYHHVRLPQYMFMG